MQNRLISGVLRVLTSFGSSNIILVLPSDPTETIVPAGDPAVKSLLGSQNHTVHTSKKIFSFKILWKEKGNNLPSWDKVKIIDRDEPWRISHLKELAHMWGHSDLLSREIIVMITNGKQLSKCWIA